MPKFVLGGDRYDQREFTGRLQHIQSLIDMRNIFITDEQVKSAQALLESDAAVDDVARALALVAGKADLTERSLLTGEDHMTTLLVKSTDGTPLTPGDVMGAVSALGDSANAGGDRPGAQHRG